jgi:hypothetical protein
LGVRLTAARVVVFTFVAAFVVFCIVQDRVTAAGAVRYVTLHSDPGGSTATIDEVMRPAVRESVREGLAWGGLVAIAGSAIAGVVARRNRRA